MIDVFAIAAFALTLIHVAGYFAHRIAHARAITPFVRLYHRTRMDDRIRFAIAWLYVGAGLMAVSAIVG